MYGLFGKCMTSVWVWLKLAKAHLLNVKTTSIAWYLHRPRNNLMVGRIVLVHNTLTARLHGFILFLPKWYPPMTVSSFGVPNCRTYYFQTSDIPVKLVGVVRNFFGRRVWSCSWKFALSGGYGLLPIEELDFLQFAQIITHLALYKSINLGQNLMQH